MTRLTPNDIIRAIDQLPKNRSYNYIEHATRTKVHVVEVQHPDGPIFIKRYNPDKGGTLAAAEKISISAGFIRRVANAATPGGFLNFERIVGGSYNVRSAFETLVAHTPQFYYCYPGRVEISESSLEIKEGHKHLIWLPDDPHEVGKIVERKTAEGTTISEIPGATAIYEPLVLSPELLQFNAQRDTPVSPEVLRRHSLIQIALVEIGRQLSFKTWVAQNDQGIVYNGKRVGEMEGVLVRLGDVPLLSAFQDAVNAAKLIDVVWFRNAKFMPAVIEVEHTTGVTSGLARMQNFKDRIPAFPTRWVIAAADEDRDKVMQECNKPQFKGLNAQFFPYSAVDELYSLCQRRKIKGVNDDFLDCFMEPCLPALQQ